MTRIFSIAVGVSLIAMAGAVSADSEDASRVTVRGREVVWQAPKAETPRALTGTQTAEATEPDRELQPRGRAGYVRR